MDGDVSESFNRRYVITGIGSVFCAGLAGCTTDGGGGGVPGRARVYSYEEIYGPMPREQFPLPAVDLSKVDSKFYRREVRDPTGEKPGTLVVNTSKRYLYYVLPRRRAIRYGVGLGRAGFEWSGRGWIAWKQAWPKWTPPDEMIARRPELAKYSADNGSFPPGLKNPLGARALYIHNKDGDTLYRVHGTNEFASIGHAVSSGCVRMLNQDVIDLYNQVRSGSPILVT